MTVRLAYAEGIGFEPTLGFSLPSLDSLLLSLCDHNFMHFWKKSLDKYLLLNYHIFQSFFTIAMGNKRSYK